MRDAAFILDAMDVLEADVITFPFAKRIAAGETISTPEVTVEVSSGVDSQPSLLKTSPPQISGTDVLQPVVGRTAGVTYWLRCRVLGSSGKAYVESALLPMVRL